MIPQEALQQYRSIRAPASLQETVMKKMTEPVATAVPVKKTVTAWKPMLAAAACLAVIVTAALAGTGGTRLTADGTSIGAAPVAVSQPAGVARAFALAAEEPLVLELSVNQEVRQNQTAVSHGEVILEDPVDGATRLQWIITDPSVTKEATLTLNIENRKTQYLLHADANGIWYMEKSK